MGLLSWLFPAKPANAVKPTTQPESSGLSRMDPTRPVARGDRPTPVAAESNAQPANRKAERIARRELLYGVVRESMVRAGMLSASYKFKVLSLDPRGRQFLIMVDLAREFADETVKLAEIEALIAQSAKARHDIVVTAVYWRLNEHVAVGAPAVRPQVRHSGPMPLHPAEGPTSEPSPLLDSQPGHLMPEATVRRAGKPATAEEPLREDEVSAFKRALAAGLTKPPTSAATAAAVASAAGPAKPAPKQPQSYTLLTGYEDTEMPDPDYRMPDIGSTQYGDLR